MDFKKSSDRIWLEDAQGKEIAFVSFPARTEQTVEIDHTVVDGSLRGQGVAGALLETLAQDLREQGKRADLAPEDFSSPLLGEAYRLLLEAAGEGRSPSPAMLESRFSPEEMGHLTTVLQKPESPAAAERALADYIRVIHESASKRRGGSQEDPLLAAKDKFKEKKGYGGKQNG